MAVKLASAYVELTVKKAGDAMKEITADIIGVEKAAQKAGKAAGQALDQGVRDGAKSAGAAVISEVTKAAEKAGDDAGKAVSERLNKGVEKGAKEAGKAVAKEIPDASKKAGDTGGKTAGEGLNRGVGNAAKKAGKAVEDEITKGARRAGAEAGKVTIEPRVNTKPAETSITRDIGGAILDGVRDAAESAGYSLEEVLTGAAKETARTMSDALGGGLSGLENALGRVGGKAGEILLVTTGLQDLLDLMNDPRTEETLNKLPGAGFLNNLIHKWPEQAGTWLRDHLPFELPNMGQWEGFQKMYPTTVPDSGAKPDFYSEWYPQKQEPPVFGPKPIPQAQGSGFYKDWYPPAKASGGIAGVDSKGKLYGPGTGTSDSILGIGADGMPTALVSRGEGVVKDAAMNRGGGQLVAALNAGWTPSADFLHAMLPGLPRHDQGSEQDPMARRWMEALQSGRIGPNGELNPGGAKGSESGLQTNTIRGRRIISALFPEIGDIGGQRQDSLKWHPSGLALDVMIPGYDTKGGKALGDQINAFIVGNAAALGSDYTMWQQKDHYNHIHSNFAESGMPGKDQQYMLPPELLAQLQAAQTANSIGAGSGVGTSLGMTDTGRTQGYIPAGAGGSGQAGTSFMSGVLNMGAQAINGLIDQAASAAATAVSAGVTVGSFGAGAAAGPAAGQAAGKAIGLVTQAAKRGVQWGFQLGGIGLDSAAEIFSPFGVSRFFQTDPTQFMPQLPGQAAPVTTGEKAHESNGAAPGPVQPGQLPGQQPVGAPAQQAQAQGVVSAPTPVAPKPAPGPVFGPPMPKAPVFGPPMPTLSLPVPAPPKPAQQQQPSDLSYLLGPGTVGTFDIGGMLQPGGIAINKTRRPEPILSTNQWGDLADIASRDMPELDPRSGGGTNDYSVHIDSVTVKDVEEMQRTIDSRQRLQMMRHAGRP
ncbi:hypothetical protein [Mycolicibacter heraklionensis]|uniref:hypothetical protein n=1 Tax=Mycolicibacter heraklionensis TaxID=512402 RepID=UPI0007E991A5|nr:hypothetical protein [Mycolicibacter heraklionensis]OBG36201.1 hypothetical protein A5671_21735 [Mycolicibacter heraklionensis]